MFERRLEEPVQRSDAMAACAIRKKRKSRFDRESRLQEMRLEDRLEKPVVEDLRFRVREERCLVFDEPA